MFGIAPSRVFGRMHNVQCRGTCQQLEVQALRASSRKSLEINWFSRQVAFLRPKIALLLVALLPWLVSAAEVTLVWEPSPEETVSGYRIYYGLEARTYLGFVETDEGFSAHITGLEDGATYYFAATAVTEDGSESDYSNEVQWTTPAPPQPTFGLSSVGPELAVLVGYGAPGGTYEIEWSPDLMTWASLEVFVVPESGSFTVEHRNPPAEACFYRRVWVNVGELETPPDRATEPAY